MSNLTINPHRYGGTHTSNLKKFKVARPGKTAADKANGHIPHRKNRRVWDDDLRLWVKV